MYGDKILIQDINGQAEINTSFEDVYDDRIYTIIDKQALGETIGKKLLDDDPNYDFYDDVHVVYEEIDSAIINDIVNDIVGYVEEYINNNQ